MCCLISFLRGAARGVAGVIETISKVSGIRVASCCTALRRHEEAILMWTLSHLSMSTKV